MRKENKTIIVFGLVLLLVIPGLATNISATQLTLEQIQTEVENDLGMELTLLISAPLSPGYDILFTPENVSENLYETRFFETYYNGTTVSTKEVRLEDPVYTESKIYSSMNPLIGKEDYQFYGNFTMEYAGWVFFISTPKHNEVTGFATVTAGGYFVCMYGKIYNFVGFVHQVHGPKVWLGSLEKTEDLDDDDHWASVQADAIYYSLQTTYHVWSWVEQWGDRRTHVEKGGDWEIIP